MSDWRHLFIDGEYAPRSHLLSGLTLAEVTKQVPGASHTIYEELWHTAKWQSIVVGRNEPAAADWETGGQQYPPEAPANELMWQEIVAEFLAGAEQAVEWGRSPEAPGIRVSSGASLAEVLESLAVHNAYHLGKIVALRQVIGAWPPPLKPAPKQS
jgi:hypothetical protein